MNGEKRLDRTAGGEREDRYPWEGSRLPQLGTESWQRKWAQIWLDLRLLSSFPTAMKMLNSWR